ncbi:MAG: hypothetical protein EXQ90_03615 [Rhodospirillales bacterium]|nr:hypothetical protein [Rhodospirillales bacterium]
MNAAKFALPFKGIAASYCCQPRTDKMPCGWKTALQNHMVRIGRWINPTAPGCCELNATTEPATVGQNRR